MLPCLGSAELGRAMWDRLLAAKTEPEARLCKVALGALADTEIQRAFTEDVKHAVSPPTTRSRASRWPNNATGRRQEARRAARAPEQGVPNVREENVREEAAVEVAAGAEEAHEHVDEQVIDETDAEVVAEQVGTQEDDDRAEDEIGESTTDRTELDEVTRRQEGGEQTLPVTGTTTAGVDGRPSELEEMPETVAVEREQVEPPDYEKGVGENDKHSLVQQPVELEEAVGDARLMGSRREGDISGRVVERAHHSFCFSPPKRDRKLSDEEQQEEAKRPKSPEREGVQLAEQHGSGGEGGEEMETDMSEILLGVGFGPPRTYSQGGGLRISAVGQCTAPTAL